VALDPDPMLAEAIGAWLIALAVAAAQAVLERDARRLRPAAIGNVLLALLLAIALARYPREFRWPSPAGIAYLAFLASMILTGSTALHADQSGIALLLPAADGRADGE
jgi:hypothetical protein